MALAQPEIVQRGHVLATERRQLNRAQDRTVVAGGAPDAEETPVDQTV
jgi:hypothetical protein